MLNTAHGAALEALYAGSYLENYLDCVENLPGELQREISQLRELDVTYQCKGKIPKFIMRVTGLI